MKAKIFLYLFRRLVCSSDPRSVGYTYEEVLTFDTSLELHKFTSVSEHAQSVLTMLCLYSLLAFSY